MVSDRTRAGWLQGCGRGSAGRASPCQGEGRGFESRRPLGASLAQSQWGAVFPGGVAERRGNGLQIRVHGFKSRLHLGRLAQRERASLTRKRSLVQIQYRPPSNSPSQPPVFDLARAFGAWIVDLSAKLSAYRLASPSKSSLMARAPRVMTGRSSFRYTRSVTLVLPWPTKCAISSMVTPELDRKDTKLCRNSRGVHSFGIQYRPRRRP